MVIGTTGSLFHAQAYRNLLGPVETVGKFEAGLPPIDLSAAPLVDESMARRVAEKRLSDVPALGSSFHLGRMVKQRIGKKLYWISFLQFNSIFVQFNQGVSPGYVRVSATDVNDVALVTTLNGTPLKLLYLTSGSFGRNLERHVYFSGFVTRGIDNFLPQLDEAGRPVYVVTLYHHAIGFAGADADGVLTVDAQSGEVKEYSLENAPAWIDRVQPEDFTEAQITDHGYYVPGHLFGGWLNPSDAVSELCWHDEFPLPCRPYLQRSRARHAAHVELLSAAVSDSRHAFLPSQRSRSPGAKKKWRRGKSIAGARSVLGSL